MVYIHISNFVACKKIRYINVLLKFRYSEKVKNLKKNCPIYLTIVSNVKKLGGCFKIWLPSQIIWTLAATRYVCKRCLLPIFFMGNFLLQIYTTEYGYKVASNVLLQLFLHFDDGIFPVGNVIQDTELSGSALTFFIGLKRSKVSVP